MGTLWREFRFMSEKIADYHRNLESEVKKRTEELEAFSYSVSHDLRAPLRAMDGFVKVFMEEYGGSIDEEGKRILSIIERNAAKMGRLIDDLITFSRLGRQEMKKTSISMKEIAQSVADELREPPPDRDIDIQIGALPDAFGSADMMRLVFTNLLGNAIKFSRNKKQPRIIVGGYANGDTATYFVKDTGSGFDMKYADKLFNVFQRLHTEKEFEGTGIGLANVKRIVERHGGSVRAEGEPGLGATFYFTLPSKPPDA
jgi:light-regulated signal transduction histidine kinase (bacteriophytochrome)